MPLQTTLKMSQAEDLFLIKINSSIFSPKKVGEKAEELIELDHKDYVIFKRVVFPSVVLFYELLTELARLKNMPFDRNNIDLYVC